MVTCIYLATKVEEAHIKGEDLANHKLLQDVWDEERDPESRLKAMVKTEVPLLEGLRFHLRLYLPFRPLRGLRLELQNKFPEISASKWEALELEGFKILESSFYTDVCLLYPPSQIALAAMHKVAQPEKIEQVHKFVEDTITQEEASRAGHLRQNIATILKYLEEGVTVVTPADREKAKQEMIRIWKKYEFCRNPAFNTSSKLYKDVEEKKERRKREYSCEKKLRKRQEEEEHKTAKLLGQDSMDSGSGEFVIQRAKRIKTPAHLRNRGPGPVEDDSLSP